MTIRKLLMASVASAAFASNAFAFDNLDWDWYSDIDTDITHVVTATTVSTPSGLVQVDSYQLQVGDVIANSTVSNISNTTPIEGGPAEFTETITLEATFDDNQPNNPITGVTFSNPNLTASNGSGGIDNNTETVTLTFDVEGEVEVLASGEQDAVDLPIVTSDATAVGNNYSIDSTVALALDAKQVLEGAAEPEVQPLFAYTGEQAEVSATSTVSEILNAAVASAATAVGNNMDVNVEPSTPSDAFILAEIDQKSYADITATSSVTDVELVNYTGFGAAGLSAVGCELCVEDSIVTPIVSSAATAVGNNLAITVGAAAPVVPPPAI